jgi:hypothetical protein
MFEGDDSKILGLKKIGINLKVSSYIAKVTKEIQDKEIWQHLEIY